MIGNPKVYCTLVWFSVGDHLYTVNRALCGIRQSWGWTPHSYHSICGSRSFPRQVGGKMKKLCLCLTKVIHQQEPSWVLPSWHMVWQRIREIKLLEALAQLPSLWREHCTGRAKIMVIITIIVMSHGYRPAPWYQAASAKCTMSWADTPEQDTGQDHRTWIWLEYPCSSLVLP